MKLIDSLACWRWLLLVFVGLALPACATTRSVPSPGVPSFGGLRRVVISQTEQMLRAYDGAQVVFETRVSTGKADKPTPNGSFRALSKSRMHYSSRYENAPMPYSVQFSGNFFLHGYSSVPNYPASHGCIRLPLREANRHPAELFYDWVTIGTPIRVTGRWQD